jgi:receptor protein-tyrosine kinase
VSADLRVNKGALLITGTSKEPAQAEALANVTAEELIVELGGPKSPFRTLEPAVAAPVKSIRGPTSHPGRALLLGCFGLFLGIGAALGVDRFDNRIRSKRTAEEVLGVPVVAEVPAIPRSARDRLLSPAEAPGVFEAYRQLRTMVDRWGAGTDGDDGHRVIVVTSPIAAEGKTATVAHLAATLAEIGRSVLAISADLRRPRLHLYFERGREPGLVDALRGAPDVHRLTDLDLATRIQGVRFAASGVAVRNPAPLIERIGDLLAVARDLGKFVLVDSPALLRRSDAATLAAHADGVLLVVRAGRTSTGAAARSVELLKRLDLPIIGVVLVGGGHHLDLFPIPAHATSFPPALTSGVSSPPSAWRTRTLWGGRGKAALVRPKGRFDLSHPGWVARAALGEMCRRPERRSKLNGVNGPRRPRWAPAVAGRRRSRRRGR